VYTIAKPVRDKQKYLTDFAPLVKRIAYHMMAKLPASVDVDDMIQAGMMGLLDAVNRYEDNHGAQFETYAARRIQGAILDELRQNDWLPRRCRKTMRDIEAAMSRLQQRLGRTPTESELAKELNVKLSEYQEMLQESRGYQLIYYDELEGSDDDHFLDRHCTASPGAEPLERLMDSSLREALVAAIDGLPEREKMVMSLHYEQELNLKEIGEVLGVSESRVCQIHTQAVARLRAKLRED